MTNRLKVDELNIFHKNVVNNEQYLTRENKYQNFEKNIIDVHERYELRYDCSVIGTSTRLKFRQEELHVKKNIMEDSKCPACNKKFCFRRDLLKHIYQFHRHSKSFKCRHCGTLFQSIRSCLHHIKKHEVLFEKNHHCEFCSQSFNSKFLLSRHLMVHTEDQLSSSYFLDKKYKHNDTEERPYACSLCEKRYIRRHNLRNHEIKHLNNSFKEYICKICYKSFERGQCLRRHLKLHTKERLYSCSICKKKFKLKYSLQQHQIVHLKKESSSCDKNLKRFSCSLCEKSYNHKRNLSAHQKIHLTKKLQYSCSLCERSYKRKGNLTHHQKIHFKNTNNEKKLTGSDEELLKKNILLHSKEYFSSLISLKHDCKLCSKSFKTNYMLKRHLLAHKSDRPYSCSVCKKTFKSNYSLSRHLETHTTGRPYSCPLCPKTFKIKHDQRRHQKRHLQSKLEAFNTDSVNNYNCDLKKQAKTRLIKKSKSCKTDLKIIKVNEPSIFDDKEDLKSRTTTLKVGDVDMLNVETNIEQCSSISNETMNDYIEYEQEKTMVLNYISEIKEEFYSDNDSRDDMNITSVMDICKTEFIYDHAIVSAAKRIMENYTSNDLIHENSSNLTDSQPINKVKDNSFITKLKLRYKILKGTCTLCNKVFECQEDFIKHGLQLHPNLEAFKNSHVKYFQTR